MKYLEIQNKLKQKGGSHLGCIRAWIQMFFRNGEQVNWGSEDVLQLGGHALRVIEFENLSTSIATNAIIDNFKTENKICMFCQNKVKYSWIDCEIGKDYNCAIEAKQCQSFHLKNDIFILNL